MFQSFLTQARAHAVVLSEDLSELAPLRPFTAASLAAIDPMTRRILDQFNIRFTKLQDLMGSQIFPAILARLAEDPRSIAFIDLIERLEALAYLPSADAWLELREMRNRLAHDYPDDPEILAGELNAALEAGGALLAIWRGLETRLLADKRFA
jgi:hypothetical protein